MSQDSTKVCRRCGSDKPLKEFSRDRGRPDGHHSLCKDCKKRRPIQINPSAISPEGWAWLGAVRRLIDLHHDSFAKMLYSECVTAGLIEPDRAAFRKLWDHVQL